MTITKRILRLLSPGQEQERMVMRQARCMAEASAEDLNRTITIHHDKLVKHLKKMPSPVAKKEDANA